MSAVYYDHLTILVEAISLLNGSSISHSDILKADELLCKFVKDFENLYGLRHMSFNIHLLRHLGAVVRNLGPLWVTSCFGFEDLNGKLADLAFGKKDAALQIGVKMKLFTNLHIIIDNMSAGLAKDYCEFLTKKLKRFHIIERISSNTFVVGYYDKVVKYQPEISEMLHPLYGHDMNIVTFPKLYKARLLYVASSYTRSSLVSSYVKFISGDGVSSGEILTFVKVSVPSEHNSLFFLLLFKGISCNLSAKTAYTMFIKFWAPRAL